MAQLVKPTGDGSASGPDALFSRAAESGSEFDNLAAGILEAQRGDSE